MQTSSFPASRLIPSTPCSEEKRFHHTQMSMPNKVPSQKQGPQQVYPHKDKVENETDHHDITQGRNGLEDGADDNFHARVPADEPKGPQGSEGTKHSQELEVLVVSDPQ